MSTFTDAFKDAFALIVKRDPEIVDITLLSFKVSITAVLLAIAIGIPLGLVIGHYNFIGKNILTTLINTLTGFPPVVMGVFLFVLFSRRGPLGVLELLYTPTAMIIAQFLLALPIIISTTIQAISTIPDEFFETITSLQLSGIKQGKTIIREIRSSLLIGSVIGFGRAISEVGAILIIGGNIRWYTRTLTTASVLEISRGSPEVAIALGIILLLASFIINLTLYAFQSSYLLPDALFKTSNESYKSRKQDTYLNDQQFNVINLLGTQTPVSIKCSKIHKSYNGNPILDIEKINFNAGNIYAVIGPNGIGKTTLLRIISGIDKNYKGKITYDPMSEDMAYLHQTPYMFKGSVLQNLKMIDQNEKTVENIIADFALSDILENDAKKLSGGEKRRVALARLFLTKPNYLVLDEPTSDLDPGGVARIERILQKLRDKGILIIMTTHNLLQAKRIGDKILIQMSKSQLFQGDTESVFASDNPEVKAFLDGTLPW
ncbi:MAG: ABC transporter permease [Candidatus Kariarchaeaceae archaeon]|jgi:ABC-type tungstate transport system substrate-binding protein/ABC-type multidrug transport system ATPase subunit